MNRLGLWGGGVNVFVKVVPWFVKVCSESSKELKKIINTNLSTGKMFQRT